MYRVLEVPAESEIGLEGFNRVKLAWQFERVTKQISDPHLWAGEFIEGSR
jgi:hypothetical protein